MPYFTVYGFTEPAVDPTVTNDSHHVDMFTRHQTPDISLHEMKQVALQWAFVDSSGLTHFCWPPMSSGIMTAL